MSMTTNEQQMSHVLLLRTEHGWTADIGPGENKWASVREAALAAKQLDLAFGSPCIWRIVPASELRNIHSLHS